MELSSPGGTRHLPAAVMVLNVSFLILLKSQDFSLTAKLKHSLRHEINPPLIRLSCFCRALREAYHCKYNIVELYDYLYG